MTQQTDNQVEAEFNKNFNKWATETEKQILKEAKEDKIRDIARKLAYQDFVKIWQKWPKETAKQILKEMEESDRERGAIMETKDGFYEDN